MPKKKKRKLVTKPFHQGLPMDHRLARRAVSVAGYLLTSYLLYLVLGAMLVFDNAFIRIVTNVALILLASGVVYYNGITTGVADVTHGEIIYRRLEEGKPVPEQDKARCFHPAKGFVSALVGVLPFLILTLMLAFIAQLQTFQLGGLPDWLEGFERRPEIGGALSYYHRTTPMGLENYLRILVRIMMMPYVNIIGADNALAMLWLERLSPLSCLIPVVCHGLGYLKGRSVRMQVHTDIAASKRKKKRQAAKKRREQPRKSGEPERLI